MESCFIHSALSVQESPQKGRGVFTKEKLVAGVVVEISPVIVFDNTDRKKLEETALYNYIFEWGDDNSQCCVALGYISMYNHQSPANCEYVMYFDEALMKVTTMRNIEKGEELTINYSTDWNEEKPVWFEAV
jgi:uncharacterized protein